MKSQFSTSTDLPLCDWLKRVSKVTITIEPAYNSAVLRKAGRNLNGLGFKECKTVYTLMPLDLSSMKK